MADDSLLLHRVALGEPGAFERMTALTRLGSAALNILTRPDASPDPALRNLVDAEALRIVARELGLLPKEVRHG